MNIKTIAVIALAAILAACLVPIAETDAVYSNVDGDPVIGTGDDAEYTITYTNHDYDSYQDLSMAISYDAKLVDSSGETISNGVSPSSGDLDNGGSATLTVDAPDTAGSYKLIVTYDVEASYTDDEGETVDIPAEDLAKEDTFDIKVVEPITPTSRRRAPPPSPTTGSSTPGRVPTPSPCSRPTTATWSPSAVSVRSTPSTSETAATPCGSRSS